MAERFSANDARLLLREQRFASLSTLMADGSPHVSLVAYATSDSGAPVLLISQLAWHTRHLQADGRASLLICADAPGDRLAGARLSLMGRFAKVDAAAVRAGFMARHPEAAIYADVADFSFWQMQPALVHAVAGFGRIETFAGTEILTPIGGIAGGMA
ncbi:MAG: CREG family protein [Aestuariivirgaceae bacterium]|nr:CREG family protein [Aestuariivirgaceae bacterium]